MASGLMHPSLTEPDYHMKNKESGSARLDAPEGSVTKEISYTVGKKSNQLKSRNTEIQSEIRNPREIQWISTSRTERSYETGRTYFNRIG